MLLRAAPYSPLRNHRPHAARSVKPMANYDWRVSVPASGEQRGHDPFPHDARVVRPRRELLPDVAPFIERDGVESREVALERE